MNLTAAFNANFEPGWTAMRLLTREGVRAETLAGRTVLHVAPEALRQLAREAFRDVNFFLRAGILEQWAAVLDDAGRVGQRPLRGRRAAEERGHCRRGRAAAVPGHRHRVGFRLQGRGAFGPAATTPPNWPPARPTAYAGGHLRHSQLAPLSMCQEQNTGTNLPAQIEIHAAAGDQYRFLFIAKGGGSSNKTAFFQKTKALLDDAALAAFLREQGAGVGRGRLPAVSPGPGRRRHQPRDEFEGAETGHRRGPGPPARRARRQRRSVSRPVVGGTAVADCGRERAGGPIRRPLPGRRCPRDPLRAARRQLPGVAGRLVQCPSQRLGPHRRGRRLSGGIGPQPWAVSSQGHAGAGRADRRRRRAADRPRPAVGRGPPATRPFAGGHAGAACRARLFWPATWPTPASIELLQAGRPLPEYLSRACDLLCRAGRVAAGRGDRQLRAHQRRAHGRLLARVDGPRGVAGHVGEREPFGVGRRGVSRASADFIWARSAAPRPGWPRSTCWSPR